MPPDLNAAATSELGPAAGLRCPSCGAAARTGAAWCTLCYTDLRPKPKPIPKPAAPVPTARAASPADPLGTAPPVRSRGKHAKPTPEDEVAARFLHTDQGEAAWPCPSCQTAVAMSANTCPSCGTGFLSGLADGLGVNGPPVLRKVTRLGPKARPMAAVAIGFSIATVLCLLVVLIGKVF